VSIHALSIPVGHLTIRPRPYFLSLIYYMRQEVTGLSYLTIDKSFRHVYAIILHIRVKESGMMWSLVFLVLLSASFVHGPKVDPLRASVTNQEQRAFIKCHVLLNTPVVEVDKMLDKTARRSALSKTQVYDLYNELKDRSRLSSEDASRPERPCTSTDITHEENLSSF